MRATHTKDANGNASSSSSNTKTKAKGNAGGKSGTGAAAGAHAVPGDASAALYLPVVLSLKPTVNVGMYNKDMVRESDVVLTNNNKCTVSIKENLTFNLRAAFNTHQIVTTQSRYKSSEYKGSEHNEWMAVSQQICKDYGIRYGDSEHSVPCRAPTYTHTCVIAPSRPSPFLPSAINWHKNGGDESRSI